MAIGGSKIPASWTGRGAIDVDNLWVARWGEEWHDLVDEGEITVVSAIEK